MSPRAALAVAALWFAACAGEPADPYEDHDEPSDFEPVPDDGDGKADALAASFDARSVMPDEFFLDIASVDAEELQRFFEQSPYGNRSWLADERIGDVRAADAIVAESQAAGINPLVMVARMQVEKSLVSKSVRPATSRIDWAFGCGCPDNRACNEAYRGLDRQIRCAADTLSRWYAGSVAGDGLWVMGIAKRTLDPQWVTPANHATASLYAYTPWVLRGSGGNWLVWNVTRKYERHARTLGLID
jgi:hypothetical protein